MLASITPLGERGRQSTWAVTVSAFLLGALASGAAAGAASGLLGALVLPGGVGAGARTGALAAAGVAAIALDAIPIRIPGPRRQVNELWLGRYRGWVYGVGYGAQLGVGITTVVTSAATYLALLACVASASPAGGALIMGSYGLVRGLTPLAVAHVRSPAQLIAAHARLAGLEAPVARAATGVLGVAVLAAGAGALA